MIKILPSGLDKYILYKIRDYINGNPKDNFDLVIKDLDCNIERDSFVIALRDIGDNYFDLNDSRCVSYFLMAIQRNDRYSRFRLGLYYEEQNNLSQAIKYLKIGSHQGDKWAIFALCRIYKHQENDILLNYYKKYIN